VVCLYIPHREIKNKKIKKLDGLKQGNTVAKYL
jgi:hypothetical protein